MALRKGEGYKLGRPPRTYGCRDYSLEMQLLQLQRRLPEVDKPVERAQLQQRISEIEKQLGQ